MNGSEMTEVVDRLAEKVGVAVDKLAPFAEEVVRQYQFRSFVLAGVGLFGCAIVACAGVLLIRRGVMQRERENYDAASTLSNSGIVCCIAAVIGLGLAAVKLGDALAPLPALLGL